MNKYNNIKLMDKHKLLEIFDYLNERFKENQLHMDLTIFNKWETSEIYRIPRGGLRLWLEMIT